jgi:hypothetical protein
VNDLSKFVLEWQKLLDKGVDPAKEVASGGGDDILAGAKKIIEEEKQAAIQKAAERLAKALEALEGVAGAGSPSGSWKDGLDQDADFAEVAKHAEQYLLAGQALKISEPLAEAKKAGLGQGGGAAQITSH